MKKNSPTHLKTDGMTLYEAVQADYGIDDGAGLTLLATAAESLDRLREAQAQIDEHGQLILDRFGQLKANPACGIERDARRDLMAALKALNLDLEPLRDRRGNPGISGLRSV